MKLTTALLSCAGFLLSYVPAASAEEMDPALFSNGSACATNTWCASVNFDATDPISGDTDLVAYILKGPPLGTDPSVVTGDVDLSNIGYVLRFEMINSAPEIFIIPTAVAQWTTSSSPTAADLNHMSVTGKPDGQQATWTASNSNTIGYDASTSAQTYGFEVVPEPSTIILMSGGLGLLGLGARRRMRRN